MDGPGLIAHFCSALPQMLEAIKTLVETETPSGDRHRLTEAAGWLDQRFRDAGALVSRLELAEHGPFLHAVLPSDQGSAEPVLVLGHYDTVWPAGTLSRFPFSVADNRASGPGIFDMKANLVMVQFALRAITELGLGLPRPIEVFLTSEEEIGSPSGRPHIEGHARRARNVLVVEPPLPGGVLKTARKGVGNFVVEVAGRSAHAGIEPEKGISAVTELAHQILYIDGLNDPDKGSTVNVGVVEGGSRSNVVPAAARAEVDVRVWTTSEAERIEQAILNARARTEGTSLKMEGRFRRPPMERTDAIGKLFERARDFGRQLDLELEEGSTGGGSDGNFSAALGIPTLDGLGAPGAGAHAEHEHILIDSLPTRTALLTLLLTQL